MAILIHATLQYNCVPLHTTLEAAAVTINSTKRYTLCSVYLSPNANIDMEELKSLIRQLPRPFLLLGDFNVKHPARDFENSADPRGRAVQSILVEESGEMFNQGRPTHYCIQTNTLSAIDLCLCSVGELWDFQLEVDENLHGSDHFSIFQEYEETCLFTIARFSASKSLRVYPNIYKNSPPFASREGFPLVGIAMIVR